MENGKLSVLVGLNLSSYYFFTTATYFFVFFNFIAMAHVFLTHKFPFLFQCTLGTIYQKKNVSATICHLVFCVGLLRVFCQFAPEMHSFRSNT